MRLILLGGLLCATALSACVTSTPPALPIPDRYRLACERAPVGDLATQGDLDAFLIRQEGALTVCDDTRSELVKLIDGFNAQKRVK